VRLFTGVEVGPAVADALARVSDELRARAATLAPRARITWVGSDRAHITVRFIGHVDDEKAQAITNALAPPIAVPPFEVTVRGVGAFPPSGRLRVVWAGLAGGVDALSAVEQEVSRRLEARGIPREERAYRPHLTLARVKEAGGLRARSLLEGYTEPAFATTRVDAITLFESRLSPKGPTYVALQQTALRG